jgi:hypothetical protein
MADNKKVVCKLKDNRNYGTAIRKGKKSGKVYTFSLLSETEVAAEDMLGFTDPESDQFVPHLQVVK